MTTTSPDNIRRLQRPSNLSRPHTVVDGEIVAIDEDGRPSFNHLQNHGSSKAPLLYYVFDLLALLLVWGTMFQVSTREGVQNIVPKVAELVRKYGEPYRTPITLHLRSTQPPPDASSLFLTSLQQRSSSWPMIKVNATAPPAS
jgi:hypothetical protein